MKFPVIDYRRQKAMRMETESNSQKGEKFGENCKHGSGMLPKYEGKLTADLKQRI